MKYALKKIEDCGNTFSLSSGTVLSLRFENINEAYREAQRYNAKCCGCQVEVIEIKE